MFTLPSVRPRRASVAALALVLVGGFASVRPLAADDAAGPNAVEAATAAAIEDILADATLPAAVWGVFVKDLRTGRTVYGRGAETLLLPASTLKLYTTATALDALGPDFRFATRLVHLGDVAPDGTLRGDLVVVGSADPTFGSAAMPGLVDPLAAWARQLADAGVRRVEGRIIGDDDRTDDEPYPEGWDVQHIAAASYAPATGGLNWADNLLALRVAGGQVSAAPAGFASVRTEGLRASSGRSALTVRRALGTDDVAVSGTLAGGFRGTLRVPVANPTLFAVHAFAERLTAAGIDVSRAALWDVDDLPQKPATAGVAPLLVHVSPRLAEIVDVTNRQSDNLYAEALLRALTPEGSVRAGTARVRAFVAAGGADAAGLSLRDGSGLSRKDLVTPRATVAVLERMRGHPAGAAFRASLPSGGAAGSTLRNRLQGVPVQAKTGSIEYARALAGYVSGPDGAPLAFSVMANNYTVGAGAIASAQDRIVRALATGQRVPE